MLSAAPPGDEPRAELVNLEGDARPAGQDPVHVSGVPDRVPRRAPPDHRPVPQDHQVAAAHHRPGACGPVHPDETRRVAGLGTRGPSRPEPADRAVTRDHEHAVGSPQRDRPRQAAPHPRKRDRGRSRLRGGRQRAGVTLHRRVAYRAPAPRPGRKHEHQRRGR